MGEICPCEIGPYEIGPVEIGVTQIDFFGMAREFDQIDFAQIGFPVAGLFNFNCFIRPQIRDGAQGLNHIAGARGVEGKARSSLFPKAGFIFYWCLGSLYMFGMFFKLQLASISQKRTQGFLNLNVMALRISLGDILQCIDASFPNRKLAVTQHASGFLEPIRILSTNCGFSLPNRRGRLCVGNDRSPNSEGHADSTDNQQSNISQHAAEVFLCPVPEFQREEVGRQSENGGTKQSYKSKGNQNHNLAVIEPVTKGADILSQLGISRHTQHILGPSTQLPPANDNSRVCSTPDGVLRYG